MRNICTDDLPQVSSGINLYEQWMCLIPILQDPPEENVKKFVWHFSATNMYETTVIRPELLDLF